MKQEAEWQRECKLIHQTWRRSVAVADRWRSKAEHLMRLALDKDVDQIEDNILTGNLDEMNDAANSTTRDSADEEAEIFQYDTGSGEKICQGRDRT